MDILHPKLVWIDNRCYRKLPIRVSSSEETHKQGQHYKIVQSRIDRDENLEDYGDLPIKRQGNKYFIVKTIPKETIKFIIGSKGSTKKKIEDISSAKLSIPENKEIKGDEADLAITAVSPNSVATAYREIEKIIQNMRWKIGDFTHFISIPVNTKSIQEKFLNFKADVLRNCRGSQGIREEIFESPARLHITIAILTLLSKREREEAASMLLESKDQILRTLDEKALQVEIKGVEYMNDEPAEVTVLYGKVKEIDSDNCLQIIANQLSNFFSQGPFGRKAISDDPDNVKLHVTLMKGRTGDGGLRETFDATQILEKYAEYSFGQTTVSEIHISIRFTAGRDSYYKPSYVLQL